MAIVNPSAEAEMQNDVAASPARHLIILPAFNEQTALPHTLRELEHLPQNFDLLVVNDGSADGTRAIAEQVAARDPRIMVVSLPSNAGIGAAVQTGYLFAARDGSYQYVIQFDADGQHDAESILTLVARCDAEQLDLCIGSRFLKYQDGAFRSTWLRRFGIRFFSRLIGLLTATKITDPTSGFRCAGPRAWQAFAKHYPDDFPEPESLFWCIRNSLRVGEVPVVMRHRNGGESSIRFTRSVYYMFKVTMAILVENLRRKEPLAR